MMQQNLMRATQFNVAGCAQQTFSKCDALTFRVHNNRGPPFLPIARLETHALQTLSSELSVVHPYPRSLTYLTRGHTCRLGWE